MDLLEAIRKRHTTNGPFAERPVEPEHKRLLLEMAARAPSHFNAQPWRFIVIEDAELRQALGEIAGTSMRQLMEDGRFWRQYRKFFHLTEDELKQTNDGLLFDHMPTVLKPLAKYLFTDHGTTVMNTFQVPKVLGNDTRKLVASSPMLLSIAISRDLYQPQELNDTYTMISLGAVVQTIWLTATSLGMGMQSLATLQELPEQWALISAILGIPEDFELLAMLRLGYEDTTQKRPTLDWRSQQRKTVEELAFQETWDQPIDFSVRT